LAPELVILAGLQVGLAQPHLDRVLAPLAAHPVSGADEGNQGPGAGIGGGAGRSLLSRGRLGVGLAAATGAQGEAGNEAHDPSRCGRQESEPRMAVHVCSPRSEVIEPSQLTLCLIPCKPRRCRGLAGPTGLRWRREPGVESSDLAPTGFTPKLAQKLTS